MTIKDSAAITMTDDNFTMSENLINISDNAFTLFNSIEFKLKVFDNDDFFDDCEVEKPDTFKGITFAMMIDFLCYIECQTQVIIQDNLRKDKAINKLDKAINKLEDKLRRIITQKITESKNKIVDAEQFQITIGFSNDDYELLKSTALITGVCLQELVKDCAMSAAKRLSWKTR